jgi:RNA polymerase sigma-70 factor (ECF subfamily)
MATPPFPLSPEELTRHSSWMRRLAQRLVRGHDEAEDLAQDVWLELAAATGPVTHLKAFTARIARRLAARRRELGSARGQREARAARDERLPGPAELEEHLETQRLLFQELSALAEVHRRPLLLHFYEGLSAAEIARRSGAPETTVRSQIQRSLAELRARLDRRHGGERGLWIALLARLPEPDAATVALGGGALALLGTAAAVVALAGGLFFFRQDEPEADALLLGSAPHDEGGDPAPVAGDTAPAHELVSTSAGSQREVAIGAQRLAQASADVALLARDSDSSAAPGDFLLELERSDGTRETLTTDAEGRAALPRAWFEASFHLSATGDEEWDDSGLERDLGPADLPVEGEPLVVTCATGPTYTLRFDGPAPPPAELFASLSRGAGVPREIVRRATLHRDGARIWTRFAPDHSVRSPKGDEPWTLVVFARDGLWRATGSVTAIHGVQAEPVWLTAEPCGVVALRVESDGGPVVGECAASLQRLGEERPARHWTVYSLLPSGQSTVSGMPQGNGTGVRSMHFDYLVPGKYCVRAGSPAHEWAQRELEVTAGAVTEVTLDVHRKTELAELRVVITSQTGTLPLPPIGITAHEVGTNTWRQTRWLPESTAERRLLRVEATAGMALELTLDGLESLPTLQWSPGTTAIARPGEEFVFTALDAGLPPVRHARVVVRSRDGAPVQDAGVTTYFGADASFLHDTDASGRTNLEPIQDGAPFDIVVIADGYRPLRLRGLALTRDGDVFEVTLQPGWGVWLDVVLERIDTRSVVGRAAGARILVDGRDAGRTDENGQILLEGDAAPQTIEVVLPGHRIAYGDIDPATFAPRAHANGPYWIVLRREDP